MEREKGRCGDGPSDRSEGEKERNGEGKDRGEDRGREGGMISCATDSLGEKLSV